MGFAARAARQPWIVGILWAIAILYAVRFALLKLPAPPNFSDFNHYYTAALALRGRSNPYVARFDALANSLALNLSGLDKTNQTPTLLLCFEPLTRMSPCTAYWIWVGISLTFWILTLCLLINETSLDTSQALMFGALMCLYPPLYEHFCFANLQITVALLIALIIAASHASERLVGLPLASAIALKAYPIILVAYFVIRRRKQVLFWTTIWSVAIGLLTLWGVGLTSFSFLRSFGFTTSRAFLQNPGFLSIDCVISRLFWSDGVTLSHSMDTARRRAILLTEAAVLVITITATAGIQTDRGWRAFALWVPAMILLSPIGEPHYLVMLVVPFAFIADAAALGEADNRVIYAATGSYMATFVRYPVALMRHYHIGSAVFFQVADQFWFAALALAYVAAYWLAASPYSIEPARTELRSFATAKPGLDLQ